MSLMQKTFRNLILKITPEKAIEHIGAFTIGASTRIIVIRHRIRQQNAAFHYRAGRTQGRDRHGFLLIFTVSHILARRVMG